MQQARKLDLLLRSKSDDEDSDPDQFSPSVLSGLAARISFIQEQNVKKSSNLSRNWREGKQGWGGGGGEGGEASILSLKSSSVVVAPTHECPLQVI